MALKVMCASAVPGTARKSSRVPAVAGRPGMTTWFAGGASAVINSLGALGGFVGSYLVGLVTGISGTPSSSFLLMGVSLMIAVVLLALPIEQRR